MSIIEPIFLFNVTLNNVKQTLIALYAFQRGWVGDTVNLPHNSHPLHGLDDVRSRQQ